VVAAANVGATTSLAQTTSHTSRKSDVAADIGVGREDLVPGIATEILFTPSYLQSLPTSTFPPPGHSKVVFQPSDPSLAPNVGPASTSGVGGFPQLAMGNEVPRQSWVGPTSRMYAVPSRDMEVEQPESVLLEQGRVARSETSEETLSPNQDGTFSYGAPSEPLGSDIEPWIRARSTKFYENLGQLDVVGAVADTARQLTPGLGARPRTSETSGDASPSQPTSVDLQEFFDVEPNEPSFKVPCLPPPRTYVTEMSATWTNVTVRNTTHETSTMPEYRPHLRSSTTSRLRSHLSTLYTLGHSSPHSSVQKWLHQVTPSAPPPTPTVVTSQAMSELPLGATASALPLQDPEAPDILMAHDTRDAAPEPRLPLMCLSSLPGSQITSCKWPSLPVLTLIIGRRPRKMEPWLGNSVSISRLNVTSAG